MLETFLEQLRQTTWVEWLGMSAGILGVWLSIKEKLGAWPLFIICYVCYIYISYAFGLKAFMWMNAVFIFISLYGWYQWSRPKQEDQPELPISRTPIKHWPVVLAFLLAGTLGIAWLLTATGETKVPHLDAFATCCGFVAQWMLSRKHMETWIFWIISDIIYLWLFAAGASWPSVLLFTLFILLAVKGLINWNKSIKTHQQPIAG